MKIYFDLDGVMANFDKGVVQASGKHYWEPHSNDIWGYMEKVPNFFYNLEVLPDALAMFDAVMHIHGPDIVEILTALPNPTGNFVTADADKRAWVADIVHTTVKVNTVIGGKNKVKWLEQHPGSLLIDDYARNIKLWIEHGGIGVLHTDANSTLEKLRVLKII